MIDVSCQCGSRFRLDDRWAGKQAKCPLCHAQLRVPSVQAVRDNDPPAASFAPPPSAPPKETTSPAATAAAAISATAPAPAPPPAGDESHTTVPLLASKQTRHTPEPNSGTDNLSKWIRRTLIGTCCVAVLVLGGLAFHIYSTTGDDDKETAQSAENQEELLPSSETAVPLALPSDSFSPANESAHGESEVTTEESRAEEVVANTTDYAVPSSDEVPLQEPVAADSSEDDSTKQTEIHTSPPRDKSPSPGAVAAAKRPPGRGLSGVSREYDDFHCQRIQQQFAWRVPAAAEFLEVNGARLTVVNLAELSEADAPFLFLPRGEHAIRLRSGEQPVRVEIKEHLAGTYDKMRQFFGLDQDVRTKELLARGARTMDVHGAPFLLNLTGAGYIAQNEWGAAERKFRRALLVNPLFAPAHLNLAVCQLQRDDTAEAERELRLAETLNVGDVFGLAGAITALRREHALPEATNEGVPLDASRYVSADSTSVTDKRMVALMTAMSKYAPQASDRGKILNNLAVHFADLGKTETALTHYRSALSAFKRAGPDRFQLAEQVFSHMENACREANFPEADEYAFMRQTVLP